MFEHEHQKRVRYGETDQMGYLYYGNYAQYYEIGRVEAFRSLGVTYKALEVEHGLIMPVVSMETKYIRPAYYDDLLTIRTQLRTLPTPTRITFHVELFNEAGKLLNVGKVVLCFVDQNTKQVVPTPDVMLTRLEPFFDV